MNLGSRGKPQRSGDLICFKIITNIHLMRSLGDLLGHYPGKYLARQALTLAKPVNPLNSQVLSHAGP